MEIKKAISQLLSNLDKLQKLGRDIEKDFLIAVQVIDIATAHEQQFRPQIEALRSELENLTTQVAKAKAELERLDNERGALKQEIAELDAERREHNSSLQNLRRSLEAA